MTVKTLILLTIICSLSTASYAETQRYHEHADIYQTVQRYIIGNIPANSEYDITIKPLDKRLKLPRCSTPLQAYTSGTQALQAGRLSIGVRCNAPNMWSIFTSATLKIYTEVLVLTRPIRRGQILTRQHLTLERRDIADLRNGYLNRIDLAENKQATRNLTTGTVLNQSIVAEPILVKRRDRIIISAATPDYSIRMQGLAMMDGIKGQSISVKNISSGRIIAATVIKPGLVSIMP